MRNLSLALVLLTILFSCEKDRPQSEIDDEIILEYLTDNNLEAVKHSSGIYYTIIEQGTGGSPFISSTITINYKGYLTNGTVFDETETGKPATFILNNLIVGWKYGIPLLQKGGKGILYIPSELGYGSSPVGSIPANSVLIFEIELVNVT